MALKTVGRVGASLLRASSLSRTFATGFTKPPARVAVTGAAGNIGYALLFRIASGALLGPDQPVILHLLEIPQGVKALQGVSMELEDCAFPLLKGIVQTSDPIQGFQDIDYALLVGARPRGPGMERADLMKANAQIFVEQGKALNKSAKRSAKVIVVGNPANTNALIAAHNAPDLDPRNFTAMTRLDHNRALAQITIKTGCSPLDIEKFAIWGNHSNTMYPDLTKATIAGKPALSVINDDSWIKSVFLPTVQKRGAAIIAARGSSSAASAANAAIDHIRDWALGSNGKWVSMAVMSTGLYNEPKGVMFSYPCTTEGGDWKIVNGLKVDTYGEQMIANTGKELTDERDMVKEFLP